MKQSLPGIKSVGYVDCSLLPDDLALKALAGIPSSLDAQPTMISLDGIATCEVSSKDDNNYQVEKATLSFSAVESIPTENSLAFILSTVSGNTYIIGAKEQPYPTIKATMSTGSTDGTPAVIKYEITYTNRKALFTIE
ncbi:hypothetical protein [Segatella bryantii]|jgi:hypothetical protein|uniref:hypothetical protein n=1 Tax=Segatella bryantii TaxID=77095 RepID=UPI00087EC411|nr:hypothetical protein [Segatella bryantii]SDM08152.1 hypothetical protein SAMN04487899_11826 [Segatella bryantii]